MLRLAVLLGWILVAAGLTPARAADPTFPPLTGRVVDQAGVLDPAAEARLDGKLAALEAKNGTQLVVATLSSLQGYDIADYGYRLGRAWGIGQQGKNNGAVLIVAPNERKVRIEVGYGLEGTLTDAISRLIIENAILPRFRVGDFSGGIERGADDIIQVLSGDAEDFQQRATAASAKPRSGGDLSTFVGVAIFLVIWLIIFIRRSRGGFAPGRRGPFTPIFLPSRGGGWGSGGGSGGGFSGGGGSFGGGGASGSW